MSTQISKREMFGKAALSAGLSVGALALFAQRAFRRRAAPALLLSAGSQAREPSASARRRRRVGKSEVFSRHRFCAARASREGIGALRRGMLYGAVRARALRADFRGRRRARSPGSICKRERRALLRTAAKPRHVDARAQRLGCAIALPGGRRHTGSAVRW